MPQLIGPLYIQIGSHCQISGISSFIGRQGTRSVELHIGDRCHIGWQTTIAVGRKVILGDDVYMAGKVFLAGFPGHPLNPKSEPPVYRSTMNKRAILFWKTRCGWAPA
ncbi:hypothetical protein PCI56_02925 [Plesiomonas shigelloides subsp. oncorhynchi]|nr:hypothetical protein [Plesiomonas shigelloides]